MEEIPFNHALKQLPTGGISIGVPLLRFHELQLRCFKTRTVKPLMRSQSWLRRLPVEAMRPAIIAGSCR